MEYAIVDIETTGGTPASSKITEIAIIISDGENELEKYETLVNPEIPIPYNITRITGIDDRMVANSPRFFEVAKTIIKLLEGKTFVAHNVNFDYGIIRNEFRDLGYEFEAEKMCTVKLSRKYFPGLPSYSLGKLSKSLDVVLTTHHRAMADTQATVEIFHKIIAQDKDAELLQKQNDRLEVKKLPTKPGIYFFWNFEGELIYVGKSIHIRKRVQSHLINYHTKKGMAIIENIHKITYKLTGNETMALLYENMAIKNYKPKHNRRQTKTKFPFGITIKKDSEYHTLNVVEVEASSETVIDFDSRKKAINFMKNVIDSYELCLKINGLENINRVGSCFRYQIHNCNGACIQEESADDYNLRIEKFEEKYGSTSESGIYIGGGRKTTEQSFVILENGTLTGFGFISKKEPINLGSLQLLSEVFSPDKDFQNVVKTMKRNGNFEKIG